MHHDPYKNPQCVVVNLGSPSSDLLIPALYALGKIRLLKVSLINGAAIAASDTDFVQLELKNGSTVLAELDSRAAHEDGIAADVAEHLNIVSGQEEVAAGASLGVNYNETDSGTAVALTDAKLVIWFVNLERQQPQVDAA